MTRQRSIGPPFRLREKAIPAFDKSGANTYAWLRREQAEKIIALVPQAKLSCQSQLQSWFRPQPNPQMPSGGGVRAKGSSPRQPLALRERRPRGIRCPPGTCRWIHEDAGPLVKCHGVVLASPSLRFIWGRTFVGCTRPTRETRRSGSCAGRGTNGPVGHRYTQPGLIVTS